MAKRTVKKTIKVGELVKWYEPYADGFMTKDAGYGVVIDAKTYNLGFKEEMYTNYTVYRNKHSDTMKFSIDELELLNEE